MKSFGLTDKGKVRKDNQDSFIIEKCDAKDCLVVALCDGMGGAKAGGLASQLSNKAFVSYIYAKLTSRVNRALDFQKILRDACTEANGVAYEYSQFDEEYNGMGTTIVGGVVKSNGNGYIINVGDSRAYAIDRTGIRQLTKDHSLVQMMVERGELAPERARTYPGKNFITRAVGTESVLESDLFHYRLSRGDCLLLCSDGLSNMMDDQEILFEVVHGVNKQLCCQRLLDIAKSRGAPDNVTSILVQV